MTRLPCRLFPLPVLAALVSALFTLAIIPSSAAQQLEEISMTGKTALVTGSTDGMGRELAIRLGALGAHVLVHGRNPERGAEVLKIINEGPGKATFYQADFSELAQVRNLAASIIEDHRQLDLLINNAGIGSGFAGGERQLSADGYEMIFQVNYLAHYLLTDLLLPLMKNSAPARIINVASGAQRPIDFEDPMMEQEFSASAAYGQSKLAQILHTFHMSELLAGTGVTFNALHPATMMDTIMVAQMRGPARTTVDEGARAVMNLAVSAPLHARSGLYFSGLQEARAHAQAYDSAARARLDKMSRELLELPL
jgi:NAD(P)-dependent dehydrogenase (short-subunit alcohol dehydrogenase family)